MSGNDEIDSFEDRHEISLPFPLDLEPVALVGIDAVDTVPFIEEPARGEIDVPSIIYLNVIPNFEWARDEVRRLHDANLLGARYFSVKAAESAEARTKNGRLSTKWDIESQIQRDNYRILVYEHVISRAGWLTSIGSSHFNKEFDVEKREFHSTLLSGLLQGLPVSQSIYSKFESVLSGIFKTVEQTKNQRTLLKQWILGFTYKWDEVQQRIFTSHRTISFELNQSMKEFVSNKSHVSQVHITMNYRQNDYLFDENVFLKIKDDLEKIVLKNPFIVGVVEIPDFP